MIRVLIADDHHLVRQGIRALLEKADDIEIVGEAEDGRQAVALAREHEPDVIVMDIGMSGLNGIQATERIRTLDLNTEIVVLTMYSDEMLVHRALRSGARGYLLKRSVTEELLLAIRAATRGKTYLSPSVSDAIIAGLSSGEPPSTVESPIQELTPREREVLQLIAEGHTNQEMADLMNVSIKTVEKHRTNLMSKLDIHDIAGLTRAAIKHGLIFVDD